MVQGTATTPDATRVDPHSLTTRLGFVLRAPAKIARGVDTAAPIAIPNTSIRCLTVGLLDDASDAERRWNPCSSRHLKHIPPTSVTTQPYSAPLAAGALEVPSTSKPHR